MRRLAFLLLLPGCTNAPAESHGALHGTVLPTAQARPDFVLQRTDGRAFDFRAETAGTLTLLFFGYTSCPDVCPATMANLGAVLGRLTSEERRDIRVVFVTTDPARDTGPVLAAWLNGHDPGFIGLLGPTEAIDAAQRAAGVSPAVRDAGAGERYTVSHAAQVIVVSPDDSVHVVYPFGTRQREWADDLPALQRRWRGGTR